ncbi:hypothetical protein [Microviridae sp.]|nr:hypothetical protein [Microviridae sp.]UOF82659.1 hypothetical protein [Microviridae sp.]UOF82697.1 hypothetical protein [Microviridae sp.]
MKKYRSEIHLGKYDHQKPVLPSARMCGLA